MSDRSFKQTVMMYFGVLFVLVMTPVIGATARSGAIEGATQVGTYAHPMFFFYFVGGFVASVLLYVILVLVASFFTVLLFPVWVFLSEVGNRIRIAFGFRK